MSAILNPCHCGHEGELLGMRHQGIFLSLACPGCRREVTAFTADGLAEAWNQPAPPGREPLPRTGDDMDLPEGKTCADCAHCRRCTAMFGHIPADESCDWSPSRFTPRRLEVANG